MTRGYFRDIASHWHYESLAKDWHVLLVDTRAIWINLLDAYASNPEFEWGYKGFIRSWRDAVRRNADKLFIYFIATRPRIRFDETSPPKMLERGVAEIHVLIGGHKARRRLRVDVDGLRGVAYESDCLIRLVVDDDVVAMPIHEFLQNFEINLGYHTEVHYVGSTGDPLERPTSLDHEGLSRVLLKRSNEQHDFFFVFNLFKVMSFARDEQYGLIYRLANSVIDEVNRNDEGKLIELLLIEYLDAQLQYRNRPSERGSLRRRMRELLEHRRIRSVGVDMTMIDTTSEYYAFSSSAKSGSDRHAFTASFSAGDVQLVPGVSDLLDMSQLEGSFVSFGG